MWHQGVHMVWKQTRVPSLSKMTSLGLRKAGRSLDSSAEGDAPEEADDDPANHLLLPRALGSLGNKPAGKKQ